MPKSFLIRVSGQKNSFGRIIDISPKGINFSFNLTNGNSMDEHILELDLYNCDDGTALEHLPVQVVSKTEENVALGANTYTILKSRAKFFNINQAQKKILTDCLTTYGL